MTTFRSAGIPLVTAAALACLAGAAGPARAQLEHLPWILKYNSGQNVQPIFHGWSRNPGGGFHMHFGYLNRNYVEELHVPVGAGNRFESGAADQGQPTWFRPASTTSRSGWACPPTGATASWCGR